MRGPQRSAFTSPRSLPGMLDVADDDSGTSEAISRSEQLSVLRREHLEPLRARGNNLMRTRSGGCLRRRALCRADAAGICDAHVPPVTPRCRPPPAGGEGPTIDRPPPGAPTATAIWNGSSLAVSMPRTGLPRRLRCRSIAGHDSKSLRLSVVRPRAVVPDAIPRGASSIPARLAPSSHSKTHHVLGPAAR